MFAKHDFEEVIRNAKWKKAADSLGWRIDFVKQCTGATISKLFVLCRDIADDPELIPERFRTNFFGERLVPISKKGGGIRPIAVGTIFHKLISSSLMNHIKDRLLWYFSPVQFGVGASGGAENIVHGIRNLQLLDKTKVVVSLDLENAFNSVSRKAIIGQVAEHFSSLTK